MRVVVLQPGYLPWLGFFDQMARCDTFVVYDDVLFDKHGWRNRNRVKTNAGVRWLTVPVLLGEHDGQPRIRDVRIDNRQPWVRKHLMTLQQNYARAPYFQPLFDRLRDALEASHASLLELDIALVEVMRDALGLTNRMVMSSELGVSGERVDRLINICRELGAEEYLSGNSASSYIDEDRFEQAGIRLLYQNYVHPEYPQLEFAAAAQFEPYLSTVDLLFNCGPQSLGILKMSETAAC